MGQSINSVDNTDRNLICDRNDCMSLGRGGGQRGGALDDRTAAVGMAAETEHQSVSGHFREADF